MKYVRLFAVILLAVFVLSVAPGSVKAQKFASYATGVNIQNLSGDAEGADISIQFYAASNADGTGSSVAVGTASDHLAPYGVASYFSLDKTSANNAFKNAPDGFKGSMVISSNKALAAVANLTDSTQAALGAYNSAAAGTTTVYLPILHKANGPWDSWYSVQNVGGTTATVNVFYSDDPLADPSTNTHPDATLSILPNTSVTVYQKDESHPLKFFAGTLKSTNDQPLVVVVVQESTRDMLVYNGFAAGSLNPVMPTINMNNYGYITGTQIYNLSNTPTNVTVSYTPGQAGTACTETQTIPGKSMGVFTTAAFKGPVAGENCVDGQRFIGSAKVTTNSAGVPLAVVVNQLLSATNSNGSAYDGFDPATASNTVFMPTIQDRNGPWYSAFNLMNIGSGTTFVQCTYAGSSVTQTTDPAGLATNTSITLTQKGVIAPGYHGSSVCKAYTDNTFTTLDPNAKIVTVLNQLGTGGTDRLLTYEGFNTH